MTRTPNTDYTKVGDSAFTNGNVISYEGENYYRACNYKVSDKPDGGTTYCVKHVDHRSNPNSLHEDFEGHEVPHGGESNLAQHARRELELIGEEPQFVDWYVGVIRAFKAVQAINDTGPKKYTKTLSPSNTEKKEQNT